MTAISLPLLTALVAGFVHALEADHMAAVTTFVSRRPHPLRALGFGVRWGVGHSIAILALGGALLLLDLRIPEGLESVLEGAVGALLLGLGLWVLGSTLHEQRYSQAHARAHSGGHTHSHVHPHGQGTLWVGVAHGLAGTAALLALLPAALLTSGWLAAGYLLAFGVGTVVAMGLYALLAGLVFHHAGSRVPAVGMGLRLATGLGSSVLGVLWIYGALGNGSV
ncbi:MAG: sulfite exporter TauE/SafE family protein [Gemmatimonadetes bacterium]|nr:sulfite exporter TauE/SafE family protein [Gemmatimonadota bacterium]